MKGITLHWIDYVLFIIMFGISTIIGVYFGCYKKQNTFADYLQGGKKMKIFPVASSITASVLSGITVMGYSTETYFYGTQLCMIIFSLIMVAFTTIYVYLPVLYKTDTFSGHQYLEIRFGKSVRITSSVMFIIYSILVLPIFIYVPALAFTHVSGISIHLSVLTLSLICIFYTAIGGLKAVIWTDVLQFSIIISTLISLLVIGIVLVGDISTVWETLKTGHRLEFFNMDADPTKRSTFWIIILGNYFTWLFITVSYPPTIQRLLAVPSINDSKKVVFWYAVFTITIKLLSCFCGLIAYAKYFSCDPFSAGYISKEDEILPYFASDISGKIPGVTGLFFTMLFSAALSSLSSTLNTLAGTIYEDFLVNFLPNVTEMRTRQIMKSLVILLGLISIVLVFVVERLGSILQAALSLNGITSGPVLGAFTMGMLFPKANEKGVLTGMICSAILLTIIIFGNQYYVWNHMIRFEPKPLHTYGCNTTTVLNETITIITTSSSDEPYWIFKISCHYYILMGTLTTILIGLPVSWAIGDTNKGSVNTDLLSPCIHRLVTKSNKGTNYESVQKARQRLNDNDN